MDFDDSFLRSPFIKTERLDDYSLGREVSEDSRRKSCEKIDDPWRKACGCIKTSYKLRRLIDTFPALTPRPSPYHNTQLAFHMNSRPLGLVTQSSYPFHDPENIRIAEYEKLAEVKKNKETETGGKKDKSYLPKLSLNWGWFSGLASLLQMCVTATALGLYYMIYCYMQLVYFTLKSALFFHQADGPMKVTIGILTMTSLLVGFNIIFKIEKLIGLL